MAPKERSWSPRQANGASNTEIEWGLLVACARAGGTSPSLSAKTRELLAGPIDWPAFFRLACDHQVEPLVASSLCHWAGLCPPTVVDHCKAVLRAMTARNLSLLAEHVRLVKLLEQNSIRAIPYKGALLAQAAYGNVGLRSFSDLDILVDPWDYSFRIEEFLTSHGWEELADYTFERAFKHPRSEVVVDVHQALTPYWRFRVSARFSDLRRRCAKVSVMGATLDTFHSSDLLVVLCIQLAKDTGDSHRPLPLIKVCDIAQLVRNSPELDWNLTMQRARCMGVLRILQLGVRAACRLMNDPLPGALVRKTGEAPQLESLVNHVVERVLNGGEAVSRTELLDAARWQFELRERLWDRYWPRWEIVRRAFGPSAFDHLIVRLPRPLYPLYYLLRPFRLAHKWSRVLVARGRP